MHIGYVYAALVKEKHKYLIGTKKLETKRAR